jgi:hypothetical protein
MTDTVALALVASIPPTIAAVAALVVGIKNGSRAIAHNEQADQKAEQIHVLVNSNMTEVKANLAMALERVKNLESMIMKLSGGDPKAEIMAEAKKLERREPPP